MVKTRIQKPKAGELLLQDMRLLVQENIYPVFHGMFKPVFSEFPDIARIGIDTETHYNDEYTTMYSLDDCKIILTDVNGVSFRYDKEGHGYCDEGEFSPWRDEAAVYDRNTGEYEDVNELPDSFEPAVELIDSLLRQFDLAESVLLFGIDGLIEMTPDSISVTGSLPEIENPDY